MFVLIDKKKKFRINQVSLTGGVILTEKEKQNSNLKFMDGSYCLLFQKNNTFLFPKDKLEDHLKENFKRIDTIEISKKGLTALSIEIKERTPFAVWCKGLPSSLDIEDCYFMDNNSTIFAKAPNFSGDAYFKYYGDVSLGDPIGIEYMASSTKFAEISDFVKNVETLSIRPIYIIEREDDDFALVLSGGGQVYFDTKESLYKTAQNLSALLRTDGLKNLDRENLPVEYIDLRFGNKLFYKLKNQ